MRSPSGDSETAIYLVKFAEALQNDSYAKHVSSTIIPKCDIGIVGILARWYVLNDRTLDEGRKARGRKERARIRRAARVPGISQSAKAELHARLSRATVAFNTDRSGRSGDHTWLYLLRAYMHFRSSMKPRPTDLAAVVQAASVALGRKSEVDPNGVSHNLRNFKKSNPHMCPRIDENIQAISDWLEKPPVLLSS